VFKKAHYAVKIQYSVRKKGVWGAKNIVQCVKNVVQCAKMYSVRKKGVWGAKNVVWGVKNGGIVRKNGGLGGWFCYEFLACDVDFDFVVYVCAVRNEQG